MNNYIEILDYNRMRFSDIKIFKGFLFFVLVFSIAIFYLLLFIKIDSYYINNCIVKEDLLVCSVRYDDIKYIVNNNNLSIDKVNYSYNVYTIDEEMVKVNGNYFININLEINLKHRNIDNNVLTIKIKTYHKSLFDYLKEVVLYGEDK